MHSEKVYFTKNANRINKCQCLKFILEFTFSQKSFASVDTTLVNSSEIMNKVQPYDSSSVDQSESTTATDEPEVDLPSAVAPPMPKVQELIDGRVDF